MILMYARKWMFGETLKVQEKNATHWTSKCKKQKGSATCLVGAFFYRVYMFLQPGLDYPVGILILGICSRIHTPACLLALWWTGDLSSLYHIFFSITAG